MPPKRLSTSETHKKRCRKSVTLGTKLEVLRRIENGEKIVEICKAMGLAKSTVQTIRDKKEDINTYLQSAAPLNVSRLTRQRNWIMEKMEQLLIIWIEDNNKRRMPMSQMDIQEKALSIFENLKNGDTTEFAEDVTFQASRGWFDKFKNRFNLYNLKMKGEAANSDEEYPNILKGIIERGGYVPEQVFNMDETGFYWKRMPDGTYISKTKKTVSKQLTSKHLMKAFSSIEQGINILLENDPDVERSAKVSREIYSAISCYTSLKNKKGKKSRTPKRARQTMLNNFFNPGPSLPVKNDDDSHLQVTISSSSD